MYSSRFLSVVAPLLVAYGCNSSQDGDNGAGHVTVDAAAEAAAEGAAEAAAEAATADAPSGATDAAGSAVDATGHVVEGGATDATPAIDAAASDAPATDALASGATDALASGAADSATNSTGDAAATNNATDAEAGTPLTPNQSKTLATGVTSAVGMDDTHIYFVSDSGEPGPRSVKRVPRAGGPVETVISAGLEVSQPQRLRVGATEVYVSGSGSTSAGPALWRMPKAPGGSVTQVQAAPSSFDLDATGFLWSNQQSHLYRASLATPNTSTSLESGGMVGDVATDGTYAYFCDSTGATSTRIYRVLYAENPAQELLATTTDGLCRGMAGRYGALVWASGSVSSVSASIYAMPATGGTPVLLGTGSAMQSTALATDGVRAYFVQEGEGIATRLVSAPIGGGALTEEMVNESGGLLATLADPAGLFAVVQNLGASGGGLRIDRVR